MSVSLSLFAGVGQQFFTDSGNVLSGGLIYSYQAGTSTPAVTFTSSDGITAQTNPIVLNSAGRVASGEIWLTVGSTYKFVLQTSSGVTIATYDNVDSATQSANLSNTSNVALGDALVGFRQSDSSGNLNNSIGRTVHQKFQESISVLDFGAVGDGITDNTSAFQSAIDGLSGAGQIFVPPGKYYIANNLTINANVYLFSGSHNVSEDNVSHNYDSFNNVIFLNPTATIKLNDGSTIDGFQIINSTLNGQLPYANTASALASIATWSGTAITQNGSDVKVTNCFIGGFAQAFNSNSKERTKIDWVNIDCIAGILIKASYDIARIENVHAWPFITTHQSGLSSATYYRSGSAFKTTTEADATMFTNCFAYGYQIGFDIQTITSCTLTSCYADSVVGSGTVGFSLTSNAELIQIIGGGSSAQAKGVYINANAGYGNITINGLNFWGNYAHLISDQHNALNINGCFFRDTNGGSRIAITLNSSLTGATNIVNNIFYQPSNAYSIATGIPLRKTRIANNVYEGSITVANADQKIVDSTPAQINYYFYGTNVTGTQLIGYNARGTATAPTIVQANDNPMAMWGYSYDGATFLPVSSVRSSTRGTPALADIKGSVIFSVNLGSSVTLTDVLVLNETGNLYPAVDNSQSCGVAANRWSAIWAANGTIQTSDVNAKTEIKNSTLGLNFINDLRPVSYKFKVGSNKIIRQKYYDEDGTEIPEGNLIPENATPGEIITEAIEGKRTHWGLLAQEVKQAVDKAKVDFGGWIKTDVNNPDSEEGLRYEELIAPLIKAVQELSAKVTALEAK